MKILSFLSRRKNYVLVIFSLFLFSWFIGHFKINKNLSVYVQSAADSLRVVKTKNSSVYKIFDKSDRIYGYGAIGTGSGYGGNFSVFVISDTAGCIKKVVPVDTRETSAFLIRVLKNRDFTSSFHGRRYDDSFILSKDVDAVTGATFTSRGYTEAAENAIKKIGVSFFNYRKEDIRKFNIVFGTAEVIIILLFIGGAVVRKIGGRAVKTGRIVSSLCGFLLLGVILNRPLTLTFFGRAMLGYFPPVSTDIYWYLLFGGTVIFAIIQRKNTYCYWICPFGAVQEGLNMITGIRKNPGFSRILEKLPAVVSFSAIVIILFTKNPSEASYEIFSTLFRLIGSDYQFVLMFIFIVLSLFIFRPWCRFLCPVQPAIKLLTDTSGLIKDRISGIHKKNNGDQE